MTDLISDKRRRNFFIVGNEVIDIFGAVLGPHAGWVYMALLRHADSATKKAFPGTATLISETGVSRRMVHICIQKLEKFGLISVKRGLATDGQRAVNEYTILEVPSACEALPARGGSLHEVVHEKGVVHTMHQGSAQETPGVVHGMHNNKTQKNKTQEQDRDSSPATQEIPATAASGAAAAPSQFHDIIVQLASRTVPTPPPAPPSVPDEPDPYQTVDGVVVTAPPVQHPEDYTVSDLWALIRSGEIARDQLSFLLERETRPETQTRQGFARALTERINAVPSDQLTAMKNAIARAYGLDPDDNSITASRWNSFNKPAQELCRAGYKPDQIPAIYQHVAGKEFENWGPTCLAKYADEVKFSNGHGTLTTDLPAFSDGTTKREAIAKIQARRAQKDMSNA